MGRNSKDNSLTRYEEILRISIRYNEFMNRPKFLFLRPNYKYMGVDVNEYVKKVNGTLKCLSKEDKHILFKEFFNEKDNREWWKKYYSKSTYYRKRFFAIKRFMETYEQ